ncbi:septin-4-like isoform X12 [Syngnathoides biaculeatus]|uniref:septin-4-like isoform X12 n=1 Tax=Syngnathoides biaculeatus TaxID=300417 RepID=UPI002ADE5A07|nr:septin-4-like isoform X12 [Syngnathoides biaculeatus]
MCLRACTPTAATLSEKELSGLRVMDDDAVHFPFASRYHSPVGPEKTVAPPLSPSPASRVPVSPGRGIRDSSSPPTRRTPVPQRSGDLHLGPASRPHPPWGRFDPYESPEDQDKELVGFAGLPSQVHRKAVKKGFTFTLMVAGQPPHATATAATRGRIRNDASESAGESGLGKSTLIDSLFLTDLYKDRKIPDAEERIGRTVSTLKRTVSIEEKGVKLRLSIVDTPGFGDAVDNTRRSRLCAGPPAFTRSFFRIPFSPPHGSWKHLEDYVEQQFEQFFRDESGLDRRNIQDNRVHCCLYFISPYGHGLRPLDVECLRALHDKVNIVPVLAKADSLTQAEVRRKKSKVREELRRFGINIYQFASCDSDDDDDFKRRDRLLKDSVPFAVIGSNVLAESRGRRVKGRTYPWGVAEVESPAHSDFLLLRDMLLACQISRRRCRRHPAAAGRLRRGQGSIHLGGRPGVTGSHNRRMNGPPVAGLDEPGLCTSTAKRSFRSPRSHLRIGGSRNRQHDDARCGLSPPGGSDVQAAATPRIPLHPLSRSLLFPFLTLTAAVSTALYWSSIIHRLCIVRKIQ